MLEATLRSCVADYVDDADRAILAHHGVTVAHCPIADMLSHGCRRAAGVGKESGALPTARDS